MTPTKQDRLGIEGRNLAERAGAFNVLLSLLNILDSSSTDLVNTFRSGKRYHNFITQLLKNVLKNPSLLDKITRDGTLDVSVNKKTGEITIK